VFGTDDEEKVCRIILAEGDLQVCSSNALLSAVAHLPVIRTIKTVNDRAMQVLSQQHCAVGPSLWPIKKLSTSCISWQQCSQQQFNHDVQAAMLCAAAGLR